MTTRRDDDGYDPTPAAVGRAISSNASSQDNKDLTLADLKREMTELSQMMMTMSQQQQSQQQSQYSQPTTAFQSFGPPPYNYQPVPYGFNYNQVTSCPPQYRSKPIKKTREPSKEKSKYAYYVVKNGRKGKNDIFNSWPKAAKYCWDASRNWFRKGSKCRGFATYDEAVNYLIGAPSQPPT